MYFPGTPASLIPSLLRGFTPAGSWWPAPVPEADFVTSALYPETVPTFLICVTLKMQCQPYLFTQNWNFSLCFAIYIEVQTPINETSILTAKMEFHVHWNSWSTMKFLSLELLSEHCNLELGNNPFQSLFTFFVYIILMVNFGLKFWSRCSVEQLVNNREEFFRLVAPHSLQYVGELTRYFRWIYLTWGTCCTDVPLGHLISRENL